MRYLLILGFLLIAAAPIPSPLCTGAGLQCDNPGLYYSIGVNRPGWEVCQVFYKTTDGTYSTMKDQAGDYSVTGFRSADLTVSTCPTCAPIESLYIYYWTPTRVFIPMVNAQY